MNGPEIALAASARSWPDTLHRFLLDHGGGLVRSRVMGPSQALEDSYDVLIIDDICSFLTPRLVARLREEGREVIGVFSPDDGTDAKRRLLECGISDVVEMDASPEEFLVVVTTTLAHRVPQVETSETTPSRARRLAIAGSASGVGCTEIAVSVARHLSHDSKVILVDLDQTYPGVAQRLGLPLYPNLHTAVDAAHHDPDRLEATMHLIGRLRVVGGVARPDPERVIPGYEISALIDDVSATQDFVVADLGTGPLGMVADACIVVGEASPVGLSRLIRAVERVSRSRRSVLALVNRVRRSGRMSDEIRQELGAALPGVPLFLVAEDDRVARAAWDGEPVDRGAFARASSELARVLYNEPGR